MRNHYLTPVLTASELKPGSAGILAGEILFPWVQSFQGVAADPSSVTALRRVDVRRFRALKKGRHEANELGRVPLLYEWCVQHSRKGAWC